LQGTMLALQIVNGMKELGKCVCIRAHREERARLLIAMAAIALVDQTSRRIDAPLELITSSEDSVSRMDEFPGVQEPFEQATLLFKATTCAVFGSIGLGAAKTPETMTQKRARRVLWFMSKVSVKLRWVR